MSEHKIDCGHICGTGPCVCNEDQRVRDALTYLVEQIDKSNATDDHGHALKNLDALIEAKKVLTPSPTKDARDE